MSSKDRKMRIRIARKEAKESRLWLRLVYTAGDRAIDEERAALVQEATELMNILAAILRKLDGNR